ncbi:MAG: hypothetical protein JNL26_03960 [Gemmatimonadetes bacterium]|nr:hypothetical protein [Gemmatimonadota bacterium]
MSPLSLLLQLLAGVVGANLAGMLRPRRSTGARLNSALGAVAGVAGGSLFGGVFGRGMWPMVTSAAAAAALLVLVLGQLRRERTPAPPMPEAPRPS